MALILLARVFEEELTQYIVDELNREIRTGVNVGDVKLSFIKKFPDASLELRDVFMASVPDFESTSFQEENTDTLFVAKHLFLRFNILKLLKRQYLVREVQVQTGKLNILIDHAGNGNYLFWDKKEGESEKNFLLELDNVKLKNILFRFDNRALEMDIRGTVRKSFFKGMFSREDYTISTGLEGMLKRYSNGGTVFLKDQKISANASLHTDPQSIKISEGKLILAGQQIIVSGEMLRPVPLDLNLVFEGKSLDLEKILLLLVKSNRKIPDDLRAGGNLNFQGKIQGTASTIRMPWIEADFFLHKGWLRSSRFPLEVREIKTKGSYSNGTGRGPRTTLIQLNGVSMKIGNSRIGGDYSVFNLIRPDFNYQIKADLDLSDIQTFISSDTIFELMQGRVLAELSMTGNQALLENLNKSDLLNFKYNANLHLEDVSLNFSKVPLRFKNFTGDAVFTDHLEIKSLNGIFEDCHISMSGRADNFLEYLLTPGGNLWMDVDLYSEKMDFNHLKSMNARSDKKNKTNSVLFPEHLYLKTRFWFDELEINEFKATQITGDLIYKPKRLSINHVELLSMDGLIVSEGLLEQQQDMHFLVKSMSEISSVDITRAFSSFNNFGQEFIVDSHLIGSLTAMVNFSAGLDETMKIKKETILADCDVVISDGELSGFDPMMKLSRFIDIEELGSIKFSTLTNEIYIRNEEVLIPKMDISSSAANISGSGIHGFDKNFKYKVKVALSELRSKRSRKISEKESEFGEIEDDGLGQVYVYLIIEGTPQGTDVRYDRRGAMQNIREQMKEERKELKNILKEEFGLFKKDSTLKDDGSQKEPPAFKIEWDEEEDSTTKRDKKKSNNSEKERFIIVWDEDEVE